MSLPRAPELTAIPEDLPPGPQRAALELANQAGLTQLELDAYRKALDEIQQARDYGEQKEAEGFVKGETAGFAKGETAGFVKGATAGFARALVALLDARGIVVTPRGPHANRHLQGPGGAPPMAAPRGYRGLAGGGLRGERRRERVRLAERPRLSGGDASETR